VSGARALLLSDDPKNEQCYLTKAQESIARLSDLVCEVCNRDLTLMNGITRVDQHKVFLYCPIHGSLLWGGTEMSK